MEGDGTTHLYLLSLKAWEFVRLENVSSRAKSRIGEPPHALLHVRRKGGILDIEDIDTEVSQVGIIKCHLLLVTGATSAL